MSLGNNYVRYRFGNARPVQYPFNATIGAPGALGQGGPGYPISIGDMVWLDPSSGGLLNCNIGNPPVLQGLLAAKGADAFPWTTNLATTQANFAAVFAGISAQCWDAASNPCTTIIGNYGIKDGLIRVDQSGTFEMACALNSVFLAGAFVAPAQNGANLALLPQTVAAIALKASSIGFVVFPERTNYGAQGSILIQLFDVTGQGVGSVALPTTTTTTTTTSTTTTTTTTTAASDRRLKQDVKRVGTFMGMPVYSYSFLGSKVRVVGLFAQDVFERYPEAVVVGGEDPVTQPWKINYGRLALAIGERKYLELSAYFNRLMLAR
jgi:hypothetical protein